MTAPTHITFAEFIYLLILTTTGVPLNALNASIIAVSSVLPDIDTAASTVGKILPFISTKIERKFGHRTLTHSVLFIVALAILTLPLVALNSSLYVCFIIGYASHPFLDTMTVNGVKLFYPFSSVKCVFPFEVNNPHRYRLQTGSKMDRVLAVIFLIGCLPTFVIAYVGYERFVRTTQHNIEAAVRDYTEFSKEYLVKAHIEAYSSLTKQTLVGSFEIIGALNPATLVFKGLDGRPHTIGKEFQADYVVENILCAQGEAARSSIRNIDMSNQLLSQITSYVDASCQNYFFGDLSTSDKVSLPENIKMFTPVTGEGSMIKLNLATCDDIQAFNLEDVFITKGLLTIKSISTHANGKEGDKTIAGFPRLENFAQISVMMKAKESIEYLKEKGDTVQEKEVIARKSQAQFYGEQINLNHDKIDALLNEYNAADSELDQKIANTEQSLRIDSNECEHDIELSKNHYVADAILEASRLKLRKELQLLSGLRASKFTNEQKANIEIRKLEIVNAQLLSKARADSEQSEIRSGVKGILAEIRETPRNNNTNVTFIIRRIP